jgi:hypothetical protein
MPWVISGKSGLILLVLQKVPPQILHVFHTAALLPLFFWDISSLVRVQSSRGLLRFPTLLVSPGHEQGSLEWCHGSRRKAWDRYAAATLGFRLSHPLVWQTASNEDGENAFLVKCTSYINRLFLSVLTCLQGTSAVGFASVRLVPRVAPSPAVPERQQVMVGNMSNNICNMFMVMSVTFPWTTGANVDIRPVKLLVSAAWSTHRCISFTYFNTIYDVVI